MSLFRLLSYTQLFPRCSNKIVDTFGFLFWIILYSCIITGILYHDYQIFFMQEDKIDKSSQIAYFGLDFISPLYAICCLLGSYQLGYSTKTIVDEIKNDGWHFLQRPLLSTTILIIACVLVGIVFKEFYFKKEWYFFLAFVFSYLVFVLSGLMVMMTVSEYTTWINKVRHLMSILFVLFNLLYTTSLLEDTHESHLDLGPYLRRRLIETKRNEDLKEEIEILIAEIGETKPFSAMGFFNVERSCLITVLATAFTYDIVLLQGV